MNHKKLAVLVGGGPAPGINSVIGAATIRADLLGIETLGVIDGFKWISQGDVSKVLPLSVRDTSRIHFRGGSHIGISRFNPTKNETHLENVVISLLRLNVDKLLTIGGDDTAFSAMELAKKADGRIRVAHVPKTIDNDLDLPFGICTFGFQTARHHGVEIVKNLMVDAKTTSRWYYVISMGRKAGHLALGIGKAVGATLTMIPEEFPEKKIRLQKVVDILAGAIIKRLSYGKDYGVAVIAEGIVERLDEQDLKILTSLERDEHDNIRYAEIGFGEILKSEVQKRLKEFGIKHTIVAKNIGYELRCSDPIPFDMEYTRDLGFCAVQFLHDGKTGALISIQNGNFVPIPFEQMVEENSKRFRVRMVNTESEYYKIAKTYMISLTKEDFDDPHELAKFAATTHTSIEEFKKHFNYLVTNGEAKKEKQNT
ncbi:6-phosphofructokinase [bacterium]|nr:6-phosphofructokinase [bacterium]